MSEHDRVKVIIVGITNSRLQEGVYMLVLAEEGGSMRMPVVIGAAEAQSIAIAMERLTPPRPMSHDLMANMCHAFELQLTEVLIHRFEKGVFYATMVMRNGEQERQIDARVSDAVALALRMNVPVYVVRDVLSKAGYDMAQAFEKAAQSSPVAEEQLESMSDDYLATRIEKAVAVENYEEAALIQQILQKRKL